ncbi:DNA-binding protein [Endogone sp. FLAS-F59071]|nr:DNA-binding protein [Endogone sp. FLAS-F59071]|eukprot:RUS23393.1 DNA-binding protein [Endogone sp. FLAS-F59071]
MVESNYFLIVSQGNYNVVQPQSASIEVKPGATVVVATRKLEGDASYESQLWFKEEGYILNKSSRLALCVDEFDELTYLREKTHLSDRWDFDSTTGLIYCLTNTLKVLAVRDGGDAEIKYVVSSERISGTETLDQLWILEPVKTRILPTRMGNINVQSVESPKDTRVHKGATVACITRTISAYLKHSDVVNIFCEFLEIAFHQILFIREIYPSDLFERRKKYNVPVQMSRHPGLNAYICDAVLACKPDLNKGVVDKICLLITTQQHVLMERFVFEVCTPYFTSVDGSMAGKNDET